MSAPGRAKRILIAGYYGFNNAGDEAVLAGLVKAFRTRRNGDGIRIVAHSIDPAATTTLHGIPAAHRYRPGSVIRSLAATDLFALGGGSLLQDATSAHSIFYYLAVARIAQIMGKKTMFIAQGIGPLNENRSRRLTRGVANRLDAITVRDQGSADLLAAIGVNKPPITVTADPALILGAEIPATERGGCAVSLREWRDKADGLVSALADACGRVLANVPVMAMPMHAGSDDALNNRLSAAIAGSSQAASESTRTLAALLEIAATAEMVIGMRLHALIFAAASATPVVAISYDPKVSAFMAQIGQNDLVFDLDSSPLSLLAELIEKCWTQRTARRAALIEKLPALREAAQRNADIALGLVG